MTKEVDLLAPFLVGLGNDCCVCVAHHSDQHVQQKNGHQDHKDGKDYFCQGLVVRVVEYFILQTRKNLFSL